MATDNERLGLEDLREELREPLSEALGIGPDEYQVGYLCEPKDVADDPTKLLVEDLRGHEAAVVLIASRVEPELVRKGMRIASEAKQVLGETLGSVILTPLGEGTLRGLSYTILPFRKPLGEGRIVRRYWRLVLRRKVLNWLADVSQRTIRDVEEADVPGAFKEPLRHLATLKTMNGELRRAAEDSLERLDRGEWRPRFVLMHGDLWEDNLLLSSNSPAPPSGEPSTPFVVIDWPGASLRGYPMYDLLRIAHSMRLGPSALRREVSRHREILGMDAADAMGHLLACLGHIGLNLGCFPMEMYTAMSLTCFNDLRKALAIQDP
jgi:hypothetical protein